MDPGPIDVLDPTAFDLEPDVPGTSPEIAELQAELEVLLGAVDAELLEAGGLLEGDHRAELEAAHAEAAEGILGDLDCGDEGELIGAAEAALEVEDLQLEAYGSMPEAAWQEVPEPYQPPPETDGLVEEEPTREPVTPGVPVVIGPAAPAPALPTATMHNLSGGPAQLFHVGDMWDLEIRGPANCPVSCRAWVDTAPLWPVSVGLTDQWGRWSLDGSMGVEHLGYWVQIWEVGGVACTPTISFNVVE